MERFVSLGFTEFHDVSGRLSVADLYRRSKSRCGIYLFVFADNLCYIGKAKDVVRRFAQHRKNHSDIIRMSFQPVPIEKLDNIEQTLIHQSENMGLKLTNKAHVSHIMGETDLDYMLSPAEQELWLENPNTIFTIDNPVNDVNQRIRYQRNFLKFQLYPQFNTVVELLKTYVQYCVPVPARTVYSFWSLSCLPSTNAASFPRYAVMNINAMETFVIGYEKPVKDSFFCFINISKSVFNKYYPRQKNFYFKYPFASIRESGYKTAGADQLQIQVRSPTQAARILKNRAILEGARLMNLRLMRKGASLQSKHHCFDLSDQVLLANHTNLS